MPLYIRATYFHPIGERWTDSKGGRFQAGLTIFKTFWGGSSSPRDRRRMLSGLT